MSMPMIPEEVHRPNKDQVIIDLLKSVALEETALANLMNTEADKLKILIHSCASLPTYERSQIFDKQAIQTVKLLDMIIMKEWLLLRKIEHTLEYSIQNTSEDVDEYEDGE